VDTTNRRGGSGVVIVGEEDGEGLNINRCGYVTPHHECNRFVIVSDRSVHHSDCNHYNHPLLEISLCYTDSRFHHVDSTSVLHQFP